MSRRHQRRRGARFLRGSQLVLGVVVAATLVGPATMGRAQEAPTTLGGVQGLAAASGLHASYNPEGVLPLPPLVDIGAPDALATIASGPATFARASVLDPGDIIANPGAVLAALSSDVPPLPAYPFRITATSGSTEAAESNPAPGLNARVAATSEGSSAQATLPVADAPAIATIGTMTAKATTATDGSTVTVTSRSQLAGLNVLGLLKIDALVTDLAATSDGTTTTFSGGTTLTGASFLGMPVTIDGDGIHLQPGATPTLAGVIVQLTGSLNDALTRLGLHVTLLPPVEVAGGSAGQRGSSGLKIDLEFSPATFPQLNALLDLLPPLESPIPGLPSPDDLLAVAQARNLASIEIGRGIVELAASPGFAFPDDLPVDLGGDLPTFDTGGSFDFPTTPVAGGPRVGSTTPVRTTDGETKIPTSTGVGALILLALLAHPFIGELVARFCTALLAGTSSEHCSWEER
jgi:hypothetical protein